MEIFLVRHTEPLVGKGICYGQSDLDVTGSFFAEAAIIRQHLPRDVAVVYSSPLKRCKRLAEHLFSDKAIQLENDLMEINCGQWELKLWDDIAKGEIEPWMKDLVNARIPGGESYQDVLERVSQRFNKIIDLHEKGDYSKTMPGVENGSTVITIVAHAGVIRSILSYITSTPLLDSFKIFSLHYGCVIKIVRDGASFRHEVLSNIVQEKETHKPSRL